MKKMAVLLVLALLLPASTLYAQTLADYIFAQHGDTLIVKDYADMGNKPNSLFGVLCLDTANVPPGRVYELKAGGWYPLQTNPSKPAGRTTVIVGSDLTIVVENQNATSIPPLIAGSNRLEITKDSHEFANEGDV